MVEAEVKLWGDLKMRTYIKNILYDLNQFVHTNGIPSDALIKEISTYITNICICKNNGYYERMSVRIDDDIMKLIKKGVMFSPAIIKIMMSINETNILIIMNKYNGQICFPLRSIFDNNNKLFENFMTEAYKINFTDEEWDTYLSTDKLHSVFVNHYLDKKDVIIKQAYIENIALHLNKELLEKTLEHGGILNNVVLENACSQIYQVNETKNELIQYILDNKIEPTQKAFTNIIVSCGNSRSYYNKYGNHNYEKQILSTINLLCDYGYMITYDDLKLALGQNVIIPNIERFNIVFDNSYLLLCSKLGYTPYKVNDLKPDMMCLRYECEKVSNIHKIRTIIMNTQLVPDNVCMKNACSNKTNPNTIKYLVESGGKIDVDAFKKYVEVLDNSKLTHLFEYFIAHNNIALKEQVKEPEEKEPVKEPEENRPEEKEPEENQEPNELKKIHSQIPDTFSYRQLVYENIHADIKKCLNLTKKHKLINYIDFRRLLLDYINENKMIIKTKIELEEPLLYGKKTSIEFNEINEWSYYILFSYKSRHRKGIKT
jgi:hypothetical protein